jgi:hypothetical protein
MDAVRLPARAAFFALLTALALALAAFLMVAGLPGLADHKAGNSWHHSPGTSDVAGNSWHKSPGVVLAGNSWHTHG